MNDHSPRRYKGSLLERANQQFKFDVPAIPPSALPQSQSAPEPEPVAPPPAPVAAPAPAPAPVPEPVQVAPPAPVVAPAPPEPVADPDPEPIYELTELEPEPLLLRRPVAEAPPVELQSQRRYAPIDRELLARQGLIVPGSSVTPLAEEFRLVKRQLLLTARAVAGADADRARMVLVCSAQPNEGKTFCAINLAISMAAEKDVEILLVDADFAKPDILDRLGVAPGLGLLDALAGSIRHVEDCIVDTDIPQLSLLPAGTRTTSDTELLASDRARAILDGLAAANPRRIVIFDSPPALAASPASVLALHVGQVMLVVRADSTTESDLRETTAMLDACEHIQLVLNGVSFQSGKRRFGSYYEESGK